MNELNHWGILGMKWGVRRSQAELDRIAGRKSAEAEYKRKLHKISQNRKASPGDREKARFRAKSTTGKVLSASTLQIAQVVLNDLFSGQANYTTMSKAQVAKRIARIAAKSSIDAAARSKAGDMVAERYDDEGKLLPQYKQGSDTVSAQAVIVGTRIAMAVAPFGASMGVKKLADVARQRQANQAIFEKWGQNVLPQNASKPFHNLEFIDGVWR